MPSFSKSPQNILSLIFIGVCFNTLVFKITSKSTLDKLREENVTINQIALKPLAFEHINQLIAETLHQDLGQPQGIAPTSRNVGAILYGCPQNLKNVRPLTGLVMHKTGGNPFFVNQFLHTLYDENLLTLIPPSQLITDNCLLITEKGWQWDINQIETIIYYYY